MKIELKDLLSKLKSSGVKIYNKHESICPCCGGNNATEAMSSGIFNTDMYNTCVACGSEYIDRVKEILLSHMIGTPEGKDIYTYPEGITRYKRNGKKLCPYCGGNRLYLQGCNGEEACIDQEHHYANIRCETCNLAYIDYLTFVFEGQEVIEDKTKEDTNE